MRNEFEHIVLRVPSKRFESWEHFMAEAPEYSIGLEVIDDTPGHRGHYVHFDHHAGVVREVTMSAAMQAYIAVRQGRLMERWVRKQRPVPVYVWNADQDVCLAAFILEYHEMLERTGGEPLLRWIVQYNNKIDVCGGLYPVNLDELVRNHFTWVFEPYRRQRALGKVQGDEELVAGTIRQVCDRLLDLIQGRAGTAPITAEPEILYSSPYNFVIADEKGDPHSRLVLAAQGHTNLISLVTTRPDGRITYSIIRGSPYDEDIFQIPKLIQAFQQAEDQPDEKIWGGSNLAAGSDSELGSSLHWTKLKEIAEPIVREAYLESGAIAAAGPPKGACRPKVLLAMSPECGVHLHRRLEHCGADVLPVASYEDACGVLEHGHPITAVFASPEFSRLLNVARKRKPLIPVVMCLCEIDAGCSDLLEGGAFRLLAEPYQPDQVEKAMAEIGAMHAARFRTEAAAGD